MIKRPGNERYLEKMMAEERKAYSEALELRHRLSQTTSEGEESDKN